MQLNVKVGVSNRHVHLTKEVYDQLFDEELTLKRALNQKDEFASNQVLTLKNNEKIIENVRVMGPFRYYNQVEISQTDALYLDIHPPVRESGNLIDSASISLVTKKGEVNLNNACILAKRHIHIGTKEAQELNIKDNQKAYVKLTKRGENTLETYFKVSDKGVLEFHVDKDEANANLLESGDIIEVNY